MDGISFATQLREMAHQLRASARSTNLDEDGVARVLLAAAELNILAEKIDCGPNKPTMRRPRHAEPTD